MSATYPHLITSYASEICTLALTFRLVRDFVVAPSPYSSPYGFYLFPRSCPFWFFRLRYGSFLNWGYTRRLFNEVSSRLRCLIYEWFALVSPPQYFICLYHLSSVSGERERRSPLILGCYVAICLRCDRFPRDVWGW